MKRLRQYPVLTLLLIIIVIGSAMLDYFTPPMGDDLIFLHQLGGDGYTCPDRSTVSFILAHIVGCNGRLFDYIGPVTINLLPLALASAVMGLMAGLFFFSVLYACRLPRRSYQALSSCVVFLALIAMPWWDSMWLRVCQFNYLWGATFCLLFIGLFFRNPETRSRHHLLLIFILGIFSGSSHEQTGVALSGAFFLWLFSARHYKRLSTPRKTMLAGLLAGTLMTLASPGIWYRGTRDNFCPPLSYLLLTTLPLLILLLIIIAVCMLSDKGRRYILSLYTGEWGVMVTAAILCGLAVLFSGIPGRTGFFSEAASIVAMTIMLPNTHLARTTWGRSGICSLIIILTCVHFAISVSSQSSMMHEWENVRDAYIVSPDGMVFNDFTNRYDVSPLTLYRVKGVADADDYWLLHAMQEAYGDSTKRLAVLPSSCRDKIRSITDSITDGNVTIYTTKPADAVETIDNSVLQYYPGPAPRVITAATTVDERKIWIATPRVRDPGDYSLPVRSPL